MPKRPHFARCTKCNKISSVKKGVKTQLARHEKRPKRMNNLAPILELAARKRKQLFLAVLGTLLIKEQAKRKRKKRRYIEQTSAVESANTELRRCLHEEGHQSLDRAHQSNVSELILNKISSAMKYVICNFNFSKLEGDKSACWKLNFFCIYSAALYL